MRLAVFRSGVRTFVAARRGDDFVDLAVIGLPDELGAILRSVSLADLRSRVELAPSPAIVDRAQVSFEPPIADRARILCLGLNYVEHVAEAAFPRPDYPVVFSRHAASFVGHEVPLELPIASDRLDYEAELVVVIGRGGRRIPHERALDHVAGYTLMNDGSVRDWQFRTSQWTIGKNFDRSGSIGPELVTADELPPGARGLALAGKRNGEIMQAASTSDMIFDVATTIAYVSQAMALEPGDLVAMGTPAGIGAMRTPPVFLRAGDVFEVEVERVGTLRNPVRPEAR